MNNFFDIFSSMFNGNNFGNNQNFQNGQNVENSAYQNYPREAYQNINQQESNMQSNNNMQGNFLSMLLSMMGKNGFDLSSLSTIFSNKSSKKEKPLREIS